VRAGVDVGVEAQREADRPRRTGRAREPGEVGELVGRLDVDQADAGREPNHHELAERAQLTTAELEHILARIATRQTLSLDVAISEVVDDDETLLFGDDLVDHELPEPSEAALKNDLLGSIAGSLTKAERDLIRLRYRDGLTMRKIGRRLGLSESRVCQLHTRLLLRLHRRFAAEA